MISDDIVITSSRAMARSYAKINLTLDVIGRRSDGYHDVEMIMQTVNLFDLILVDRTPGEIKLSTNLKYLPVNDKNIAYKAAELFFAETGIRSGVRIMIHKNIPVAAGLAGGSGNGAAVLAAMNQLFGTGLSERELCRMGAKLGADVPYCIMGGTQLSRGIGEILTPLPALKTVTILLVKPSLGISTAAIYEEIDHAEIRHRPDTAAMIRAISENNIGEIAKNLCNVMESVTQKMHPIIRGIKTKMLKDGALGALMSGSGPTVFGIFEDEEKAYRSAESFSYQFKDTFLVRTYR